MGFIKTTGLFSDAGGFISDLRGKLTYKSARILKISYLKVWGDGTPLKNSWGDASPCPLGSYAPDNNQLNIKITSHGQISRCPWNTHSH